MPAQAAGNAALSCARELWLISPDVFSLRRHDLASPLLLIEPVERRRPLENHRARHATGPARETRPGSSE
jgi:hypothetical protein